METRLLKQQMTAAYQYSYTRLVLNDYTLYETLSDSTDVSGNVTAAALALNELVKEFADGQDIGEDLLKLRKELIHTIEILASYTDCLVLFEYVLNRQERKFYTLKTSMYTDEAFSDMAVAYITGVEDVPAQKSRISEIIGQLPVRYTRQKFFDRIIEGLKPYIGSPKKSLDDMMYMLRTESMVLLPDGMAGEFPEYGQVLEELLTADYKNLDKYSFDRLFLRFQETALKVLGDTSSFVMLAELANDLEVLVLAGKDAVKDLTEEELYAKILRTVTSQFDKEGFPAWDDGAEELLTRLEGRQEAYYDRYMRFELPAADENLRRDSDYIRMVNVDRMISGSIFAKLLTAENAGNEDAGSADTGSEDAGSKEAGSEAEEAVVDRKCLEETVGQFTAGLEEVFARTSKPVVRAVMARVLSELPVMFASPEEIRNYIFASMASCSDENEKETCKELLEELIENENNLV